MEKYGQKSESVHFNSLDQSYTRSSLNVLALCALEKKKKKTSNVHKIKTYRAHVTDVPSKHR